MRTSIRRARWGDMLHRRLVSAGDAAGRLRRSRDAMNLPYRIALAGLMLCTACSPATMGINRMADALSATASAFGRDDDPEFVRIGAPSTLKMVEMMLDDQPTHPGLLLTACSGYTQYAYAFLQVESEI